MRDIATKQVGYAPDERGRDYPPEVVFETAPRQRTTWFQRVWTLGWLAVCLYAAVRAVVFITTGAVL